MEKKKENLNQRSVQQQIGMISDQKCTVQISITHSLHSFQNCKIQLLNKYIFKPAQVQVYYRSSYGKKEIIFLEYPFLQFVRGWFSPATESEW